MDTVQSCEPLLYCANAHLSSTGLAAFNGRRWTLASLKSRPDLMKFRFCPLCGDGMVPLESGPDRGRMGCRQRHYVHYDNPAVTAFAFVERGGRYLVLKRGQEPYRGRWELPGGFVEAGERPNESVIREILEETGLHAETLSILGAYNSRYGDNGKWTVDVAFRCLAYPGELSLSAESSDAAWVSIEQMPPLAFAGERSAFEELKQKA
jgi:ADP-ribose pyrophosphatase YjhB (NUDIX family)